MRPVDTDSKIVNPVGDGPRVGVLPKLGGLDDDAEYGGDDAYNDDDYVNDDDFATDDNISDDTGDDDGSLYDDDLRLNRFIVFTGGKIGRPRDKWNDTCTLWCRMVTSKDGKPTNDNTPNPNQKRINWNLPVSKATCSRYIWQEFKDFCDC